MGTLKKWRTDYLIANIPVQIPTILMRSKSMQIPEKDDVYNCLF